MKGILTIGTGREFNGLQGNKFKKEQDHYTRGTTGNKSKIYPTAGIQNNAQVFLLLIQSAPPHPQ